MVTSRRSDTVAWEEGFVTADMLAQWAYCPRRLYLMYREGLWQDNAYTLDGTWIHRSHEKDAAGPLPGDEETAPRIQKSLLLESERLRLRAKLDLVEWDPSTKTATPVETKRAVVPPTGKPYPPERIQLGAQALLLRDHGYKCDSGVIYYAGSRTRISLPIEETLCHEVSRATREVERTLRAATIPAPLDDSPKCAGCSLVEICLPDETRYLSGQSDLHPISDRIRRLIPPRDDALPLYVQEQGTQVRKRGEQLVVAKGTETLARFRLIDVSQLVLCGRVGVTSSVIHELCWRGIPIVHLSLGHWFYGITVGPALRNAFDRAAQYARAADPAFSLRWAREIVATKIGNQRTMLRRNGKAAADVLQELQYLQRKARRSKHVDDLRGCEGQAAAIYFANFATMLRSRNDGWLQFQFRTRNRRPPADPINAMLSFGYALLVKDVTVALWAAGLDPYWGLYHTPRHGRPSLALDLMEVFRPLIVDSAVITVVNTGSIRPQHFIRSGSGCALTAHGRKAFIQAYEKRMDQLVTHPTFGYRISWRRVIAVQARLLARFLRGGISTYPAIRTR